MKHLSMEHPHTEIFVIPPLENSTLIPPAGFSLSEDVDTTPSFILTEYDLDLRVLRGCYEGLKSPKKVEKKTRNRPPCTRPSMEHRVLAQVWCLFALREHNLWFYLCDLHIVQRLSARSVEPVSPRHRLTRFR